jgi:hypothetical protein
MSEKASNPHLHDRGVYHCPGMYGEKRELDNYRIQEVRD